VYYEAGEKTGGAGFELRLIVQKSLPEWQTNGDLKDALTTDDLPSSGAPNNIRVSSNQENMEQPL
jgi:hypothetical protein